MTDAHANGTKVLVAPLLALCCLAAGAASVAARQGPRPADLPDGIHALAGIAGDLPHTDLRPLGAIIGDARFVALGESTHASRGYYQAKFRLIRYMVEELGFRALAFESPWLEALPAAHYVASCAGSAEAALGSLFRIWHDTSVLELLRWLCEYNREHPEDPVTFFGFDIQEPWRSVPAVEAFLARAAPDEAARARPLRRCLGATHGSDQFYLSQQFRDHVEGRRDSLGHAECIRGVDALEAWLDSSSARLVAASSAAALEEARIALIAVRAYQNQLWVPDPGGYQARDSGMAQALLRLHALNAPDRKTIIWAWNWHIARSYEHVRGFDDDPARVVPRQGARAMGSFLHDALGSAYFPIALIGYHVQINSGGITPPLPTSPLSVERRLHELGHDYLLVDLRRPLTRFLPPGTTYQVSQEWGDPYRQFGALLFLDHSLPMTYVPTPRPR